MDWLKVWVGGICAAAIAVSLAKAVAPQNPAGRCVPLVGALIVVLAVISPFHTLRFEDVLPFDYRYSIEYEKISNDLQKENEKIQVSIIEDKMSTYIFERAQDMGIECDGVFVAVKKNEDGYLYPESAKVIIDKSVPEEKINELKRMIRQECDIPEEELQLKLKGG